MKELFETLADMCSTFHRRLRINGFSNREALKLTQAFVNSILNNKPKLTKEENKNG
jgi:hypothetical protein